jgi:CelD/BcsL family acetyltransferase involved in cellulose biosynthesis
VDDPADAQEQPWRREVVTVDAVPLRELAGGDWDRWAALAAEHPTLDSPYFRPEFAQAVAAVQPLAEAGIIRDAAGVAGFFPYERHALGIGKPLGAHLSDFQAVIGAPDLGIDVAALLRGCKLTAFDFDHQLALQSVFAPFAAVRTRSPFVDVRAGFDAYVAARRDAGSHNIPQIQRRERHLAETLGPIRFEPHTSRPDVFQRTLEWKRAQYRRSKTRDALSSPRWVIELLERLCAQRSPAFAGMVSALYAGDRLVASHIGMRSATVWHYWFPAYDRAYAAFSPGSILLLRIIEHAAAIGIGRIDLGKGEALYKSRFMNGAVPLIEGRVELDSAVTTGRRTARRIYQWARMTAPARALRRVRHGSSS